MEIPVATAAGWRALRGVKRVSEEYGVCIAESRFVTAAGEGIGDGLHALWDGFDQDEEIVEFVGERIDGEQEEQQRRAGSIEACYCVEYEDDTSFLNCYASYMRGDCWASAVNSTLGLRDDVRQRAADWVQDLDSVARDPEPNAVMVGEDWRDDLDVVHYSVRVVALRRIQPGEEIIMRYWRSRAGQGGLYLARS